MGGSRHGFDFQNLHRNKQAMTLNLKSEEGHAIFMKLAEEGRRHRRELPLRREASPQGRLRRGRQGQSAHRLWLDRGLRPERPGRGAPRRRPDRAGHGRPDVDHRRARPRPDARRHSRSPTSPRACCSPRRSCSRCYKRERTGKGQWVHTSLIEAQIFMLDFQAARWLMKGEVAKQAGNDHPTAHPDRRVPDQRRPHQHRRLRRATCGSASARRWARRSCSTIPSTRRRQLRSQNRKALNERIGEVTKTNTSAALDRGAEQGRRAVRADQHDRPDLRRAAGPASRHRARRSSIPSSATSRWSASRSTSSASPQPKEAASRRRSSASTPTRC